GDRFPTADALRSELDGYLAQHMTPTRDKGLGSAVIELFRDERAQIRQVIETQMRGSRPGAGTPLPALQEMRPRNNTGELPFASFGGATAAGARTSQSIQLTYGGHPSTPSDPTRLLSRR